MLKSEKEEQSWLKKLQDELIEDRKMEKGNASPLFYTLMEPKKQIVPEGYSDGVDLYDTDTSETTTVEEVWDTLSDEQKETMEEDYLSTSVFKNKNPETGEDEYCMGSESDFINYLTEYSHYQAIPYENQNRQAPDCLFLTRKHAKTYLKQYGYNHPKDTVTYAMTAVRSPQYEHLLELLYNIDWEQSELEFQIPEWYIDEDTLRNAVREYVDNCHIVQPKEQANLNETIEYTKDQNDTIFANLIQYLKRKLEIRTLKIMNERYYNPIRMAHHINDWQKLWEEQGHNDNWNMPFHTWQTCIDNKHRHIWENCNDIYHA